MSNEAQQGKRLTPTQARAARRDRKNRRTRFKRWLAVSAVGLVTALFILALFVPSNFGGGGGGTTPTGPGERFDNQGNTHIELGGSHPVYNSNPATSGWHYDQPASWGVKTEPLPPERFVHNMEHGGIVLHHNCADGCEDVVNKMTAIANAANEAIVMPNPEMESRFALTAWNFLLTMEEWDDELAREFGTNHLNSPNAPEGQAR